MFPQNQEQSDRGSSIFSQSSKAAAVAAPAKLLQLCLILCNHIDSSPPGSSVHGIFQARVLEWGAIAFRPIHAIDNLLVTFVVAMCSGKQTHSEEQCRQWSAVYYTGGPKAESPLSQGPRRVFVKTLYTLSVCAQTHLPKFPENSLKKGKERYNQS